MAVIAFIHDQSSVRAIAEYASWAANQLNEAIRFVALSPAPESDPAIGFDAYQDMETPEDMFHELAAPDRRPVADMDPWGVELVQEAARVARRRGVERVSTDLSTERFASYAESGTDSTDLLVISRQPAGLKPGAELHVHRRMVLAVPSTYSEISNWMIAYNGDAASGRAVEYLTGHTLLQSLPGVAVTVHSDHQARLHFRDAVQHLTSTNHRITAHEFQGNQDDVLTAVLTVQPADLLVTSMNMPDRFKVVLDRTSGSKLIAWFKGPVLIANS